jgi:hypothetical protein
LQAWKFYTPRIFRRSNIATPQQKYRYLTLLALHAPSA